MKTIHFTTPAILLALLLSSATADAMSSNAFHAASQADIAGITTNGFDIQNLDSSQARNVTADLGTAQQVDFVGGESVYIYNLYATTKTSCTMSATNVHSGIAYRSTGVSTTATGRQTITIPNVPVPGTINDYSLGLICSVPYGIYFYGAAGSVSRASSHAFHPATGAAPDVSDDGAYVFNLSASTREHAVASLNIAEADLLPSVTIYLQQNNPSAATGCSYRVGDSIGNALSTSQSTSGTGFVSLTLTPPSPNPLHMNFATIDCALPPAYNGAPTRILGMIRSAKPQQTVSTTNFVGSQASFTPSGSSNDFPYINDDGYLLQNFDRTSGHEVVAEIGENTSGRSPTVDVFVHIHNSAEPVTCYLDGIDVNTGTIFQAEATTTKTGDTAISLNIPTVTGSVEYGLFCTFSASTDGTTISSKIYGFSRSF